MKTRDNTMTGVHSTLIHSLLLPVFFLLFMVFYEPYGIRPMLTMENSSYTFNVTMLFCIILVSTSITRCWLYFIGRVKSLSKVEYAIWCCVETVIAALFMSLYLALMLDTPPPFYELAVKTIRIAFFTCIYPYAFIWIAMELKERNRSEVQAQDDNSLIRFHDEYKKLRFVIAPEAVLYIKSEDNYAQIYYLDHEKIKKFTLRSSMKALEDTVAKHGMIRCHRSYFINPAQIRMIRRDSSGIIVAEFHQNGLECIPISKKYQDQIANII